MGKRKDLSTIEGALYVADHPLTVKELQEILGTSSETYVRRLIDELRAEYHRRGGSVALVECGRDSFRLQLRDEYMEKLERIVPKMRISRGALKTLAMIAYKQNLTQAKLAELRGNRVYEHIRQLQALGFIESKPFGRTRMLRTSRRFAAYFGMEDDMDRIRERIEELLR
ncbi:MAG: SMC-Scp complex subunit ScpB [Candidatus Hadarchaeales archaeon]